MLRLEWLKRLGPGLLFAAAAIGVSHLVQSTRAGALYGLVDPSGHDVGGYPGETADWPRSGALQQGLYLDPRSVCVGLPVPACRVRAGNVYRNWYM
jgi:hypothetical protein